MVSRQLLTVHDASSLDHPEWFDRKFALWYAALLPRLIRKVRAIITVSDFSKERLIRLTGVKPDRVHMIYNAVDQRFRPANPKSIRQVSTDYGLNSPYILFVGSLEPRKNLRVLLQAWRSGGFDGATLAVVGASGHLFPKLQLDSIYPLAAETLDLGGYDLVISSDSGPTKGVLTDPGSMHICYCHSPMRYLGDGYSAYVRQMSLLTQALFGLTSHYVRNWDYAAPQRVDHFIANSSYVAGRIRKYYRRNSTVIHSPIDTSQSFLAGKHEDYYLAVGRLVPYKRTDILIEARCKLGGRLVIAGDGPEMKRLRKPSARNIEFLGEVSDLQLRILYARCRALLFAADEDFGMVPLEAQSYGRPVIAFGKGGSLETVIGTRTPPREREAGRDGVSTGVFFEEQTAASLATAILAFESCEEAFVPQQIRRTPACSTRRSLLIACAII
jgi:glycosyltransferase involved in cell wall biosynthesis